MDTKQSFLQGLSKKRYLEVLKSLPPLQKERVREYGTLILTFLALSFFGIFAINPTLVTITDLRKQLADNQAADKALKTKITNLSTLQQLYTALSPDLGVIDSAIPKHPDVIQLLAKVQSLSQKTGVRLQSLQVGNVSLTNITTPTKKTSKKVLLGKVTPSYTFLIRVQGQSDDMLSFLSSLLSFDRIVTVDSVTVAADTKLVGDPTMTIHAITYFLP